MLVLDRLEENRANPLFWNVPAEIRVFLIEAMNEAALIAGEPQIRFSKSQATQNFLSLAANQTVFDLTNDVPLFGTMRMESISQQIIKTTPWDLDRFFPGWESDTGPIIKHWFPIGLTRFGIHPQLTSPASVIVSGIAEPVSTARPYTGNEPVDFQEEYREAFIDYAVHVASLKEGTKEFTDSIKVYDRFLSKMEELSKFATRKGSLRFSRSMGVPATVTPVEQR